MKLSPMQLLARLVVLASLFATAVRAGVTIDFGGGQLYDQNHVPLSSGSLVLLVADTGNNGFSPLTAGTLTVDSLLANSDDLILAMSSVTDLGSFQGVSDSFSGVFHKDWTAGNALALIWFADVSGGVLYGDEHYGLFTSAIGEDGSDPWITPANGTFLHTLTFITTSAGGSVHADSAGDASLTVAAIPEPATSAACAGLLALALVAWRRRARA